MFIDFFLTSSYIHVHEVIRYVSLCFNTVCLCLFRPTNHQSPQVWGQSCSDKSNQTHLWRRALQQRWWRPLHHSATAALTFSWGNSNWISHSGEETLPERTAPQISCRLVLLWRCSNRNQDQRLMVTVPQQHMHPQTSYYITTALQQEGHWFKSWQKLLVFLFTVNIFLTFPNNSGFKK